MRVHATNDAYNKGIQLAASLAEKVLGNGFFFPSARSNATLVLCEYIPFRVVSIRDAYSADSRLSGSRMSSQRKLARRVRRKGKGSVSRTLRAVSSVANSPRNSGSKVRCVVAALQGFRIAFVVTLGKEVWTEATNETLSSVVCAHRNRHRLHESENVE